MEADGLQKSGRIIVRRAAEQDAETLSWFAAETFRETFGPDNKPSDMDDYLRKSFSPEIQRNEIANSAATIILALDRESSDDSLIGYAHLIADQSAIELKRFYVATSWKGRGLAQLLFHEALAEGHRRGGRRLWLTVWDRNDRAIAFYKKMGFRISGRAIFQLGEDTQTDHMMEIAL
jgi:diamine N-acetyltransferase